MLFAISDSCYSMLVLLQSYYEDLQSNTFVSVSEIYENKGNGHM
jgi:hypothetical protein